MTIQITQEEDDLFLERNQFDLKKQLKSLAASAISMVVNCEESFRKITGLYAESKEWEKRIEFLRKEANAPYQEKINLHNDKAKELLTPLREIQDAAKRKSAQYQQMLEEKKRLELESIRQAVDILGLEEAPYVAPADKSQRGDGAIAYTRTVRKFRIVDQSKVPAEYLMVNEAAIEMHIKLGVAEIPGVEIYEEKVTQLRTR